MIGLAIPLLLVVVILVAVVAAIRRLTSKGDDTAGGADIVAYLILALAMGVAGFAIAELATTAFPGDRFVFDPAENVATALAALAVSAPFLVYFWRRQAIRRQTYPAAAGWTVYLTLIELVFMTAFVVATVLFVNGLLTDDSASAWTGTLVFGVILLFHEFAVRRDPPLSDANELPRVVGSAIGLITGAVGLAGTLTATFSLAFESLDVEFEPWAAMLIVGVPVWAYHWLREWPEASSVPRLTWSTVVTIASLAITIGSATSLVVMALQYVLTETPPAGEHFETSSAALGLLLTSLPVWVLHRRTLGSPQSSARRAYQYSAAAIGLIVGVGSAIWMTIIAFDRSLLVGGSVQDVITASAAMIVGLVVWRGFTRTAESGPPEAEAASWPRRLYHLGFGIVFGLVAAGSLITVLLILFQRILDGDQTGSLLTPVTISLYTGLVAWYLLAVYAREREELEDGDAARPFDVTIITSHPGMIATKFPKQARVRVIHRADDVGGIDEETADEIVAAVANRPSLVWVDDDGFRVAPKRQEH